jgi:hypothetical protein
MEQIAIGKAELRTLKRLLSHAASGSLGFANLTVTERKQCAQLLSRLFWGK